MRDPEQGDLDKPPVIEIDLRPLLDIAYLRPILKQLIAATEPATKMACVCLCGSESGGGSG